LRAQLGDHWGAKRSLGAEAPSETHTARGDHARLPALSGQPCMIAGRRRARRRCRASQVHDRGMGLGTDHGIGVRGQRAAVEWRIASFGGSRVEPTVCWPASWAMASRTAPRPISSAGMDTLVSWGEVCRAT